LDAARILEVLFEFGVAYTVIGGLAVQAHGHTRTTQDVDLVPRPDPENLERLAHGLDALESRAAGQGPRLDAAALAARFSEASVVSLDTDAGGVDVHLSPPGAAPYHELAARALVIEVAGVTVSIAGRDDLIAMKRASGRPIDRGDVIALTAAEREVPREA
jgi:predicted nucleotidyltransferase